MRRWTASTRPRVRSIERNIYIYIYPRLRPSVPSRRRRRRRRRRVSVCRARPARGRARARKGGRDVESRLVLVASTSARARSLFPFSFFLVIVIFIHPSVESDRSSRIDLGLDRYREPSSRPPLASPPRPRVFFFSRSSSFEGIDDAIRSDPIRSDRVARIVTRLVCPSIHPYRSIFYVLYIHPYTCRVVVVSAYDEGLVIQSSVRPFVRSCGDGRGRDRMLDGWMPPPTRRSSRSSRSSGVESIESIESSRVESSGVVVSVGANPRARPVVVVVVVVGG